MLLISEFDLENVLAKILDEKYGGKNSDFDFVPLLLTYFYSLLLSPVSVVTASFFNYLGLLRWF